MLHFHRKRDILAEVIWTALSVIVIGSLVTMLLRNEPLPPPVAFVLVALLIVGAVDGARVRSWVRIKHDHPMPKITEVALMTGEGRRPAAQVMSSAPLDPRQEAAINAMLKALADSMAASEPTDDEEDKPSAAE
jgi:hypothetical protein